MSMEDICELCGEKREISVILKDGTKICPRCKNGMSDGFHVAWDRMTKNDLQYLNEMKITDDNFNCDFEFDGFRADTKAGVFAVKAHMLKFEFNNIQKYYINYFHKELNHLSNNHMTEISGAKLIIELNHPYISQVEQLITRDKSNFFGEFALSMINSAAKNAYTNHNKKILDLLKRQTGKSLSLSKKEIR